MAEPRLFTRPFLLLVTGHFLQALGYSSLLLLPLYLEHLGASRAEIGLIMGLGPVGGLLSRPLVAWTLDAFGRRPTLIAGTLFLVGGMLAIYFVRDVGPLIYLDRLVFGVGAGTLFTGYFAWASDVIPPERRTEGIALFGVSGLLPLAFNAFAADVGIAPPDLRVVFAAIGLVVALSLVALAAVPEVPRAHDAPRFEVRAVLRSLRQPPLWGVWLATGTFAGLVGLFMSFATVTAAARGVPDPADLWLWYAVGAVGVRSLGSRLPDRVGPANVLAPALGSYVAAFLVTSQATTGVGFQVAGLLAGFGHGYCFPVLVTQVVGRTPAAWRGSAMAMFTATWQLTEFGLPPLLGVVADRRSDAEMYAWAAVGAVALLAVWALLEHRLGERRGG